MTNEKETKNKKNTIIILTLIAIIIALLSFILICYNPMSDNNTSDNSMEIDSNAIVGGLETKSKEELQEELNKKLAEGMMNISMNLNPVFEDGKSDGNLMIINESINNYSQWVEIILTKTGEQIYKSGLIPVGHKIENAKLTVDLDAGVYECTAYFHQVDESGNELGKAGAKIELTVKN